MLFHESCCRNPLLSVYPIYFRRSFAVTNCSYRMHLINSPIWGVLLFKRSTWSRTFERYNHYFKRLFSAIKYFQVYCVSLKLALAVIAFFKYFELIDHSRCSNLFDQCPFSMLLLLFHGTTQSDPSCQEYCIYFTTHTAVIYYCNKWSVVDSRKFVI